MSTFKTFNKSKRSNRDSLDIVRDILLVASVKVRKTRIMYQANLSFVQVKKYMSHLLEKGLLEHDGESFYVVTEKGLEFLQLHQRYTEDCRQLNKRLNQTLQIELQLEKMCSYRKSESKLSVEEATI